MQQDFHDLGQGVRCAATVAFLVICLPLHTAGAQAPRPAHVKFSEYSPLAGSSEIARRTLSPLIALEVTRRAAQSGRTLVEQTIKLADEDFIVFVPAHRPPRGYALLVFLPPWEEARLPAGWAPILERYGTIFVSASRSGNDESVMERREPLALLAAVNVMRQLPVDADQVFIGGFSGGARVAQRLALAYPDLFRGAILNAGSDPIASQDMPLPARDLFSRFQEHSRIVYVTGEADTRLATDQDSMRSMHQWCMFAVEEHVEPFAGHQVLGSNALAWALSTLLHKAPAVSRKLAACRAEIDAQLMSQLNAVEQQLSRGTPGAIEPLLRTIDARYGGLAAPRSIELAYRLAEPRAP